MYTLANPEPENIMKLKKHLCKLLKLTPVELEIVEFLIINRQGACIHRLKAELKHDRSVINKALIKLLNLSLINRTRITRRQYEEICVKFSRTPYPKEGSYKGSLYFYKLETLENIIQKLIQENEMQYLKIKNELNELKDQLT